MEKTGVLARAFALLLVSPVLGVVLGSAGCGSEDNQCVLGTANCGCTSAGACIEGLSCNTGRICVAAGNGVTGNGGAGNQGGNEGGAGGAGGQSPMGAGDAGPSMAVPVTTPPTEIPLRDAGLPPPGRIDAEGTGQAITPDGGPAAAGPSWTVLIYGHGDHNLSPSLAIDLAEMNAATISPNVKVIFLADWNAKVTDDEGKPFPAGTFWYRIRGGGQPAQMLAVENELDLDDPNIMAAAVKAAFKAFPSDRYGLILWDHGGGWRFGFGGDLENGTRKPRGMRFDTVAAAVRAGLGAAGLEGKRRLDFLAFDTCLLGSMEVATEFADVSKIFIGNAELDYGDGLDYEGTLSWLSANPAASAAEFAIAESKIWDAQHKNASVSDRLFRSHVALDTEKFEAVAPEVASLVSAATPDSPGVAQSLFESLPSYLQDGQVNQAYPPSRDIGLMMNRLKTSAPDAAAAAGRVLDAVTRAKVAGVSGELRDAQLGVSVFGGIVLTLDDRFFGLYPDLSAKWASGTNWGGLLTGVKAAAPRVMPKVTGGAVVPPMPTQADPPRINFEIAGTQSSLVTLLLAQQDPGNGLRLLIFGAADASLVGVGPKVAKWFGRKTELVADRPIPLTVMPWQYSVKGSTLATALRRVRGYFTYSKGSTMANLIVDDSGVARNVELTVEAGTTVQRLSTVAKAFGPDALFIPTLLVYDHSKRVMQWEPTKFGVYLGTGAGIAFSEQPAPAGQYGILMDVVDLWGNKTIAPFEVNLPKAVAQ